MKKYNLRFNIWIRIAWTTLIMLAGCVVPVAEETATVQPITLTPAAASISPSPGATLLPTPSPIASKSPLSESVIPFCTFAVSAAPEETGASLDDYVFSEPQVVLTHTGALGIANWLPDSERLLLTRQLAGGYESIEVFDVHTGILQVYAQRWGSNGKPVWLPALDALVYSAAFEGQVGFELWLSRGDPQKVERVLGDVEGTSLSLEPQGQRLWYSSRATGGYPQHLDVATRESAALTFTLAQNEKPWGLQIAWRPDGTRIAFHNYSQLFLVDLTTNQTCEVELESVCGQRCEIQQGFQWSPDGRYLAMRTTVHIPNNAQTSNNLTILDTFTGDLQRLESEIQYLYDMTWSSDSQTLALLGSTDVVENGPLMGLFVLNVKNNSIQQMFPGQFFGGGPGSGWMLAWSPDNHAIAIKCPVWPESESREVRDQVCIIKVQD